MFGLTAEERALVADLRGLKDKIEELLRQKKGLLREVELSDEVLRLKTQISDLEVKKSTLEEKHAREDRELRHMIGLEKKRQEVEIEQAKRETGLTVREENLAADKKRFGEEMTFQRQRFEEEVKYLKDMMGQILSRLPDVNVELRRGK